MKVSIDKNAGAIYISFSTGKNIQVKAVPIDENIVIDYTKNGKLHGIEILNLNLFDLEQLKSLQYEDLTDK